jgi:pimeloyl-ACP methyl ester carboxylesterase
VIAASHRVERKLTPALRGHGASDWPNEGYTIEDHLDDLLAVIGTLCEGPIVLCGQATGATLALMAAHRLGAARVRAVVAAQPATAIPAAVNDLVQRQVAAQTRFADRRTARAALPFVRFWTPAVIEHHLDHMLTGNDQDGWTWRYHAQGVSATEAQLLRTLDDQMSWDGPTLIIGGQDSTVLPHASIEAIAARLPRAELHWLPRSDHRLCQDNPDGFARLLDSFLEQVLA